MSRVSSATSPVEWNCCRPPSSSVHGQPLTTWNIICHLPHGHLSTVARLHFLQQDAQWPWLVWKWFICVQWRCGILNTGCRTVGSSTREKFTTKAYFQSTCHWLVMFTIWTCDQGLRDSRQLHGGENTLSSCHSSFRAVIRQMGNHSKLYAAYDFLFAFNITNFNYGSISHSFWATDDVSFQLQGPCYFWWPNGHKG